MQISKRTPTAHFLRRFKTLIGERSRQDNRAHIDEPEDIKRIKEKIQERYETGYPSPNGDQKQPCTFRVGFKEGLFGGKRQVAAVA